MRRDFLKCMAIGGLTVAGMGCITSRRVFVAEKPAFPIVDTNQTKCNFKEIPCPEPGEPFYG
ncbi:hypothetical protein [Archaeoglobus fulgidus]|uniref:hypothetical protein n=1 Tax=Archaeoglobus fulgidus TaxID=2234 RepID=UPI000AF37287|nr:hypothetical protein [Archaeoglobus fulgidus]